MIRNMRPSRIAIMLACCCTILSTSGCSTLSYSSKLVSYDASPAVEDAKVEPKEINGVQAYAFETDAFSSVWTLRPSMIYFTMTNKSERPIKILWDNCSIIDTAGIVHRVGHQDTKYIDMGKSSPPTNVPKGGMIADIMLAADLVYFSSSSGWMNGLILPANEKTAQAVIGKTIKVLLALEIEDQDHEYTLTFEITGAEMK